MLVPSDDRMEWMLVPSDEFLLLSKMHSKVMDKCIR